jgi:CubicO group peptidase (beta-lactamase class C family)
MKKCMFLLLLALFIGYTGSSQGIPDDSARLVSYFDGLIQAHMDDANIAGATLSFVKDGKIFFSKGYGYADLEKKIPVEPDKTLFRIGSVSKLFVWTAVMQLYEKGQLDLDTDVNEYLTKFKVPEGYEEPVTLKHLMTHTAGFEDYILGLFAKDSTAMKPMHELLQEQMPERVRPPGVFSSYSNHGTAIAACVVEELSGKSFQDYVEEHILTPLGMTRTTFRQPIPDAIDATMSKGYEYKGGELQEKYFEYVPLYPVGGASSTAEDMAQFLLAHIQKGTYSGMTILDSTTSEFMQNVAFRHDNDVNPMRYGFMDLSHNNLTIIGHGGDTFWFHTLFAFFPDLNMGLFISFNSAGGGGTYGDVLNEFTDHFYPENMEEPAYSIAKEELEKFAGDYRANRYPHTRFTKISVLMGHTNVSVTKDGKLRVKGQEVNYYIPIAPLTFRHQENSNTIVFKEDQEGNITHMFQDLSPIMAYEKVATLESTQFHQTIFSISLIVFLITIIYWPLAYFIRREYRQSIGTHLPLGIKLSGWLSSFLLVLSLILVTIATSNPYEIVFGVPGSLKVALVLPYVAIIITLFVLYNAYKVWLFEKYNWSGRIHYTLLVVALLITFWQLNFWNLIGFQY